MCVRVCRCACGLGCSLIPEVGESFEFILVDLLDDAVFHGRQDGFFTCKVLVEVIDVPFGFLREKETRGEISFCGFSAFGPVLIRCARESAVFNQMLGHSKD